MVDELADDARVICEATVGPWKDAERYGAVIADAVPWIVDETERKEYGGAVICEGAHQRNRAFIVRARTRYPALVAEVREWRRTAYVLAMAILQSDLYETADDELRASMERALPHSLREGGA